MRSRGLVVVLALILATLATAGVFLYSRGVKEDARSGGDLVQVIVSKVDIPANSDLNALIRDDRFVVQEVPQDAVISDAITQISQLQSRKNSVFIFAGEQIPLGRVQGGTVPGGLLSLPEGHQAMTVALDAPRAISGALTGGDNITIYATFTDVDLALLESGGDLNKAVKIALRDQREAQAAASAGQGAQVEIPTFDTTVVLVPEVEVLRVIRPTTQGIAGQSTRDDSNTNLQVILALEPEEAQQFVFALEQGSVYLSLLAPEESGADLDPLTVAQIVLPGKGQGGGGGA
jgi:Flp pilus assembly protein CpaB